jgi:hypothetical protein
MQRPGHLVAVALTASDQRATNLQGAARAYAALVRQRVHVPTERAAIVAEYLRRMRLWRRYAGGSGSLGRITADPARLPAIELQDVWLAEPELPSAAGAVTDEVIDELPQLAMSLGLIRERNHTRTDRGRALARLYAGTQPEEPSATVSRNLLRLVTRADGVDDHTGQADRIGAATLLLHALLDADGDFMRAAWSVALNALPSTFTRATFGDLLPEACRELADQARSSRHPETRRHLSRLRELARDIETKRPSTQRTWGGGRPRDQAATLRLEPYVDLGIIAKPSRFEYSYTLDERRRAFLGMLCSAEQMQVFLDDHLVEGYLRCLGREPKRVESSEVWEHVMRAYSELQSGLGYASFRDVALLAIARAVDADPGSFFEVSDGIAAIRSAQQRDPARVRFGVTRAGEPRYMRLMRRTEAS